MFSFVSCKYVEKNIQRAEFLTAMQSHITFILYCFYLFGMYDEETRVKLTPPPRIILSIVIQTFMY